MAYFSCVSQAVQMALAAMLEDLAWVDQYHAENKRRLKGAYDALVQGG
jgi:aspartate/methionine/tyrosine aminotransferase